MGHSQHIVSVQKHYKFLFVLLLIKVGATRGQAESNDKGGKHGLVQDTQKAAGTKEGNSVEMEEGSPA